MKAERARLARLKRLERIRDIARRNALAEAGKAEGTLAQLLSLADRTERLSADYGARTDAGDAHALQQMRHFIAGLDRISTGTRADAGTGTAAQHDGDRRKCAVGPSDLCARR